MTTRHTFVVRFHRPHKPISDRPCPPALNSHNAHKVRGQVSQLSGMHDCPVSIVDTTADRILFTEDFYAALRFR